MKKNFRSDVIKSRSLMDDSIATKYSDEIIKSILSLPSINSSKSIMLYLDFNHEVKTNNLVLELLKLNKNVIAPITLQKERELLTHKISNLDSDITIGAYGIREPNKATPLVPLDSIDAIIVPAVAYDTNGYRLGYGGGFYDRFLDKLNPNCIKIGVAFELQVFDDVPKEPHDAKLDYIITESRIIKTN